MRFIDRETDRIITLQDIKQTFNTDSDEIKPQTFSRFVYEIIIDGVDIELTGFTREEKIRLCAGLIKKNHRKEGKSNGNL